MSTIIEIRELSKSFAKRLAVDRVHLALEAVRSSACR
jgi:hypothetical protein